MHKDRQRGRAGAAAREAACTHALDINVVVDMATSTRGTVERLVVELCLNKFRKGQLLVFVFLPLATWQPTRRDYSRKCKPACEAGSFSIRHCPRRLRKQRFSGTSHCRYVGVAAGDRADIYLDTSARHIHVVHPQFYSRPNGESKAQF